MRTPTDLSKEVNRSGFPLQIAIEHAINTSSREHGWSVLHREHAWRSKNGDSGFADLILEDGPRSSVLVIECKRVLDSDWIFLTGTEPDKTFSSRLWVNNTADHGKEHTGYFDVINYPACFTSEFCVVPGNSASDRPMLERVAADVLSATEALALEEFPHLTARKFGFRCYGSLIVTTANLHLAELDPSKISIQSGTADSTNVRPVNWVRFRKQFSADFCRQTKPA